LAGAECYFNNIDIHVLPPPVSWKFQVRLETENGKIIHYREYWNPVAMLEIAGNRETFRSALERE
jgi:hypothetical protein